MRTRVYIDGLNLFYGALKGTPYKWLNLERLCVLLLPKHQIDHIYYCTARVSARRHDPNQPRRQETYLRALQTIPNLTIVEGEFLSKPTMMRLAQPTAGQSPYVRVIRTEEKGSDVNLASLMLADGFKNLYDVAVLISNDSDLALPLQIIRQEVGKTVGILNPHRRPSRVLSQHRDFYKPIRKGVLRNSQFPRVLQDQHGTITKPSSW